MRVVRLDELDNPIAVEVGDEGGYVAVPLRTVRVGLIMHSTRRDSVMSDVVLRLCRAAGFEPIVRHEVDETSTLVTLVAGGLGAAIVPEPVSALKLGGVTYVPLSDRKAVTELAVAHLADRAEPHLERAVATIRRLVTA